MSEVETRQTTPPVATQTPVTMRGTPPAANPHELFKLIGETWPELVEVTATWLASGRRASTRTRGEYARDLSWWLYWCSLRGVHPTRARPIDADQYGAAVVAADLANSTINRRLAACSSWYTYVIRGDLAAVNPFEGMERPPTGSDRSATRGLSPRELAAILGYTRDHETPRTYALLWLLTATGTRVGGAVAADIDQLGWDSGHRTIDIQVKGGRVVRYPLPPAAAEAINWMLAERNHPDAGALFATTTGRRIDEPYVWRLVRRVARNAGVPQWDQVSPHSVRHSVATALLDQGYPLHVVQDLLGHADPRTTRRYDQARASLHRSPSYSLVESIVTEIDRLQIEGAGEEE